MLCYCFKCFICNFYLCLFLQCYIVKNQCFCLFKFNYKLIVMNQRHFTSQEKHKTNRQSVLFSVCVLAFS